MPLAREVVQDLAVEHGACIRPVQLRRTNLDTGEVEQVLVPCGHTLASVCPSCAERAQGAAGGAMPGRLAPRARAGHRPGPGHRGAAVVDPDPRRRPALRDQAASDGQDTSDLDELVTELDDEITKRGDARQRAPGPAHHGGTAPPAAVRTPRTCPAARSASRTVGKTYTAPDGKTFRPSMFLTLTCPSYGRVRDDGAPADPGSYDYARAARDALHFAALFDRFIQNLRRFLGYDVQYFAAVEPQRRLAPHIHIAMRGTVSRAELRRVLAATYHQVWWPGTSAAKFDGDERPVWDEHGVYVCRSGHRGGPAHLGPGPRRHRGRGRAGACGPVRGPLRRPGRPVRLQGRGPVHRLPDQVPHQAGGRLPPGRRPIPNAPTPTGWPRRCGTSRARPGAPTGSATASSPRTPGPAWSPAPARARPTAANTSATPGAGSWPPANGPARPWPTTAPTARTGSWPRSVISATDPARYTWEPVTPGDPDHMEHARRLLHVVADRLRWQAALD